MGVTTGSRDKLLGNDGVGRMLTTNRSAKVSRHKVMSVGNTINFSYTGGGPSIGNNFIVPSLQLQVFHPHSADEFGRQIESLFNSLFVVSNTIDRTRQFSFTSSYRLPDTILKVEVGVNVFSISSSIETPFTFVVGAKGRHVSPISNVDHYVRFNINNKFS
jgi:hypothetical protein